MDDESTNLSKPMTRKQASTYKAEILHLMIKSAFSDEAISFSPTGLGVDIPLSSDNVSRHRLYTAWWILVGNCPTKHLYRIARTLNLPLPGHVGTKSIKHVNKHT